MMKLKMLVAACAAFAVSALSFADVDRSTPENTIRSFIKCLQTSDYDGMLACVKGSKRNAEMEQELKKSGGQVPEIEVTVTDVVINGSAATAKVTLRESKNQENGDRTEDHLSLEKVGENWLIVPKMKEPRGAAFIDMVASMLVSTDNPFASAKAAAKKTVCLSNIKQLATAFMILACDYDDIIKVRADSWKKAVMPYVKNDAIFHCPLDPAGIVSYSINPLMAGFSTVKVKDPAKTVLLYEGSKGKLNFVHGGFAAVAYADGHAKMVNAEQAKKLIWKP